jgi:hypothetical protein
VINATYSKNIDTYTVNVVGGTFKTSGATSGVYPIDYAVTLKADAAPAGKQFSYWQVGADIVGYSTEYLLLVKGNTIATAVFATIPAPAQPVVVISGGAQAVKRSSGKWDVTFTGMQTLPTGLTLVERGFIGSYYNSNPLSPTYNPIYNRSEANFNFSSTKTTRIAVGNSSGVNTYNGIFLGVADGWSYCARAYMIYQDSQGHQYIIYSTISVWNNL